MVCGEGEMVLGGRVRVRWCVVRVRWCLEGG